MTLPLFEIGDHVLIDDPLSPIDGQEAIVCRVEGGMVGILVEREPQYEGRLRRFYEATLACYLLRRKWDGYQPAIALAACGDDRPAPDGDAFEAEMLRKLSQN